MKKASSVQKVTTPAPDVETKVVPAPTAETVREMLDYDPLTGLLRWKLKRGKGIVAGDLAGYVVVVNKERNYKRVSVSINNRGYKAHRLIWLIVKGIWPEGEIDHIDGDGTNNRWDNLRDVNHAQNNQNKGPPRNNTSGVMGVRFDKRRNLYSARIHLNHKEKWLGYYKTLEEAKEARNLGVIKYQGEFGRLQ